MLVMMPGCSPGSNQVGAIETCTAQVIWPSGPAPARGAGAATRSARANMATSGRSQVCTRMGPSSRTIGRLLQAPSLCQPIILPARSARLDEVGAALEDGLRLGGGDLELPALRAL